MRLIDVDALRLKFQEECLAECAVCPHYEKDENNLWRCLLIDRAPIIDKWVNAKNDPPLPYTPVLVAIYDKELSFYYRGISWVNSSNIWIGSHLDEDEEIIYWAPLLPIPENKYAK